IVSNAVGQSVCACGRIQTGRFEYFVFGFLGRTDEARISALIGRRVSSDPSVLCGAIGLGINQKHNHAELGYWIGKPFWGNGYCTEAAQEVLRYGFEKLGLHRICASHFAHNPTSGRVMQKIGMTYEGCRRQHTLKWGEYIDVMEYGILKSEWQNLKN
ncbi:GNAT family N-acetyltransferase, partial [Pelatocladus sp. BLCC-F211]|uniref:GNAT family N-acetyltransferase n=1 Tax=Pelatocladus sp. BLCC-F211 TaxID=3342752 RepID=UPI0035B9BED1